MEIFQEKTRTQHKTHFTEIPKFTHQNTQIDSDALVSPSRRSSPPTNENPVHPLANYITVVN